MTSKTLALCFQAKTAGVTIRLALPKYRCIKFRALDLHLEELVQVERGQRARKE